MIVDPEGAVDKPRNIHAATGPAMNKIEFFVAMPGTKEKRKDRVLSREEKYNRELGQGNEPC